MFVQVCSDCSISAVVTTRGYRYCAWLAGSILMLAHIFMKIFKVFSCFFSTSTVRVRRLGFGSVWVGFILFILSYKKIHGQSW